MNNFIDKYIQKNEIQPDSVFVHLSDKNKYELVWALLQQSYIYLFIFMSSKNSNQSPSSNPNRINKNWKIPIERHKTTNSLIFQDHHRQGYIGASPKNSKNNADNGFQKFQVIQRHSSEEDFKKHFGSYQVYQVQPPDMPFSSSEQEYYKSNHPLPGNRFSKNSGGGPDKFTRFHPKIPHKEKPVNQQYGIAPKSNPLKQTSSTQSAENLKINSQIFSHQNRHKVSHNKLPNLQPLPANLRKLRLGTPRSKRENFKIICKLGEGKFGKVFMVKEIYTGFVLAMKIVEKRKILEENLLDQFIRELRIQSFLDHPNIISMYGFFHDQTHFYELMELGCDGQLYSLISNNKQMTQETTSFIIKHLLQTLDYIHSHQVLHRDIKPENIVLVMGNVKLCDFGWAVNKMHPGDLRTTFCGTPLYLSPQILQGQRYDEKVDLWAIGILAYELIFGCSPFDINDEYDLQKIIKQDINFPKEASQEFKQFILAMLAKDPIQRLTSAKLLNMEFITKYQEFETCEQLCK